MSIHDAIAILYRVHCTVQCSALQLHAQWNDRSYSKHSVITNEFNKQKAAEINRNMKHQTLNTVQHFIMIHLKKKRQKTHTHDKMNRENRALDDKTKPHGKSVLAHLQANSTGSEWKINNCELCAGRPIVYAI